MELMQKELQKCPICDSTNGYEFSGIVGTYAQCRICKAKWKLLVRKEKIIELTLHELPKNGSSIHTITSTKTPLFTVIGKPLLAEFWKNLQLDKEVNWEFLSKNVSSDVSKAIFAEKGEKLLYQWEGTRRVPTEIIMTGKPYKTIKTEKGILLLSNQKLRWLERRNRGSPKNVTSFLVVYEIPLQEVRGISGDTGDSTSWTAPGSMFNISVVDKQGENTFRLHYGFLEVFRPIVERAIEIRKNEIEAEKKKERLHVVLDFSFLKTYMKKGGLIMEVLRCPQCSATIEFPKSGTQTKCSYCGNIIYAQDIFEKVKSLLE